MKGKLFQHSITIRPLRSADSAAVARMIIEYNGEGKHNPTFIKRHFCEQKKTGYGYVAGNGKKIVGCALTSDWANFNKSQMNCMLDFLFVNKEFRDRSIGRKLAAYAAAAAIKRGCTWFRTSAYIKNKGARRLYQQLGFTERSYRPILYLMEGNALHQLANHAKIYEALIEMQMLVKKHSRNKNEKRSLADELIAERRREAQKEQAEMDAYINKGLSDIKAGRVKKFDAKRIVALGRKKLKKSAA